MTQFVQEKSRITSNLTDTNVVNLDKTNFGIPLVESLDGEELDVVGWSSEDSVMLTSSNQNNAVVEIPFPVAVSHRSLFT